MTLCPTKPWSKLFSIFNFFSFFLKFIFNWRIIALQYCVGFCHILTWISHPSHPSGSSQSPGLSFLSHIANSHQPSGLHAVACMFPSCSLHSHHPLLPSSCQCPLSHPFYVYLPGIFSRTSKWKNHAPQILCSLVTVIKGKWPQKGCCQRKALLWH